MLQGARGQNCEQQGDRLSSAEGNRKEFEVASRSRRINSCEIEGVKAPVGERTAAELMYSFVKSAVKLNFERRAENMLHDQQKQPLNGRCADARKRRVCERHASPEGSEGLFLPRDKTAKKGPFSL